MHGASKVQKSKNRFVHTDILFAELASDFGGELVVGGGPFREPPTVMQSTVSIYIPISPRFASWLLGPKCSQFRQSAAN